MGVSYSIGKWIASQVFPRNIRSEKEFSLDLIQSFFFFYVSHIFCIY